MDKYQVMRDLTESEMNELRESIKSHGVLAPLAFDEDGNLLDGHHRKAIIDELGIKDYPRTIHAGLSEPEKLEFARTVNVTRRQLTPDEKREETARSLLCNPNLSDGIIANKVGVTQPYVSNLRKKMEKSGELIIVMSSIGADGKTRPRPVYANTDKQQRAATAEVIGRMNAKDTRSTRKEQQRMRLEEKAARQKITKKITPKDVILKVDDIRNNVDWDWIEPESVNLLLCDMPYDEESVTLATDIGSLAQRVLKEGGACLVMCGLFYLPEVIDKLSLYMKYHWLHCVLTPGAASKTTMMHKQVSNGWKPVLWFVRPDDEVKANDLYADVFESPQDKSEDKKLHPHGQSLEVFSELILRHSLPYDVVLDPFNGSGTTGEAAVRLGRQYIGVDIDPECIRITEERLAPLLVSDENSDTTTP